MSTHNVFRDGRVHVMRRQCKTCIFGPNNVIDAERIAEMVGSAQEADSTIICHSTLDKRREHAACRGFFDSHRTTTLELARAMEMIDWDEVAAGG